MIMNTEKLKVIAEGMGYTSWISDIYSKPECWYETGNMHEFIKKGRYNPTTNNDQMVEIMEKILNSLKNIKIINFTSGVNVSFGFFGDLEGEGKTINEAVCNAAYEYFKK